MKKRLRIIIISFSISFAIMASLSLYSLSQFRTLTGYSDKVENTNRAIALLLKIENGIKEYDIHEKGYMITGDSAYVRGLYNITRSLSNDIGILAALMKDSEIQNNELIMLKTTLALRVSNIRDNVSYINKDSSKVVSSHYVQGQKNKNEALKYVRLMLNRERLLLGQRFEGQKYYQQITSTTLLYLLAIFGIVTIVIFFFMISELKIRMAYQDELQTKVTDLKRSHSELEQIAFAASHDLQEPLRKIRVFSNRLLWLKKEPVDDESKITIERINAAAGRMQALIDDMVNLTSLIKEDGEKEIVDLNHVLKNVLSELDERIQESGAIIHQEVLPEVKGYSRQFHILFKSLLDNSLKFRREDLKPVIAVRADKVSGDELIHINKVLAEKNFYRITISDNGIGFDNKFISKMFQIFQRLHNQESEFEGKGIGLAMCQRIIVNHEGHIIAHGHPEVGATFKLFLPIEQS